MASGRRLGSQIVAALSVRRYRRWGAAVAFVYLILYLCAIQNIIVSPATDLSRFVDIPSIQAVPEWTSKVFKQVASFYYEPVVAIYPVNHVTILVSPLNIAMGTLLGALVGVNIAVALYVVSRAKACRRRAFTGLPCPGSLRDSRAVSPPSHWFWARNSRSRWSRCEATSSPSRFWRCWYRWDGTRAVPATSWGLGRKPRYRIVKWPSLEGSPLSQEAPALHVTSTARSRPRLQGFPRLGSRW